MDRPGVPDPATTDGLDDGVARGDESPERLLAGLDRAQLAAVTERHRPLAIIAPAGSGKTRVLTRRVAWLAQTGEIDIRRTLCVSFTREAAGELRSRVGKLGLRELPAAGTFHAVALALLRSAWADQGRRAPNVLADRAQYLHGLDSSLDRRTVLRVETELAWAKARGLRPRQYRAAAAKARRRSPIAPERFGKLWETYESAKAKGGLVDFDDLLAECCACYDDAAFAAAQRWRFRHVFVDEFQDVNPAQFALLNAWLGDGSDLTVVGDHRQAVYGWNGADPTYLTAFENHFPTGMTVRLDTNYRSSPQVVRVAAAVLGETPPQARRADANAPTIEMYDDEAAEATGLVGWSRGLADRGVQFGNQAVLVRTNALARHLAGVLHAANVPATLMSDRGRKVAARLLADFDDVVPLSLALTDLIAAQGTDQPIDGDGWRHAHGDTDGDTDGDAYGDTDGDWFDARHTDGAAPKGELATLEVLAAEYRALDPLATCGRFVAWLGTDRAPARGSGVSVGTFHAAKGLEWQAVHVAGLEEGYVPVSPPTGWSSPTDSRLVGAPPGDVALPGDEERRLVHVALSRATEHLTVSWSRVRQFGGAPTMQGPSPLLDVITAACASAADELRPVAPPPRRRTLRRQDGSLRLRDWRRARARALGIGETALLPDDVLAAVVANQPRSTDELAQITGMGQVWAQRVGPGILAALGES